MSNVVSTLTLTLVGLPEKKFRSWPTDRPLAMLADDARALRRRAVKGIGVGVQRGLFVQLARRIDTLALAEAQPPLLRVVGIEAEACLRLEELVDKERTRPTRTGWLGWLLGILYLCLQGIRWLFARWHKPKQKEPLTPPVLGEQVLFPGKETLDWSNALRRIRVEELSAIDDLWKQLGNSRARELLKALTSAFARAHTAGNAVVRVLHDRGVSDESEVLCANT